jgi:predicted glycogen debranching enzyme
MARYPGVWAPHGHQSIESFDLRPWPSFLYLFGSARIERDVLMAKSQPAVVVRYRVSGQGSAVELALRPLLPFRDADALTFENFALDPATERLDGGIRCRPYAELPAIHITVAGAACRFDADPVWYRRNEYASDLARGYDGHEDQFSPGTLRLALESGQDVFVAASVHGQIGDIGALWKRETAARRAALAECAGDPVRSRAAARLVADDFLFRAPGGRPSVIAGFPWFGEWGRDTFVSLPGLLLARGETGRCREALLGALPFLDGGLMPNIFGVGRADSSYGSADASLWFARAVRLLELASGGDVRATDAFLPALTEIADAYTKGTRLGIACDEGGLVRAGAPDVNATWMDARTSAGPVTPRDGCAVEIEALWYSLLAHLEDIHKRRGEEDLARSWGAKKRLAGTTFLERFWLPDGNFGVGGFLADTWKDGVVDRAMRPNMVIAAALEWSPLSRENRADIVRAAKTELLVPRGLRTLEPRDPRYRGHFAGSPEERDLAYHQGTVWPWLLGPYVSAYVRVNGGTEQARAKAHELLRGIEQHLSEAGLGQISEIFDADPPHGSQGCFAQAWSVGEILRALCEDIYQTTAVTARETSAAD